MSDNERRADQGERAIRAGTPDFGQNGADLDAMRTDATDAVASVLHAGNRYGLSARELLDGAFSTYNGDAEDGPQVEAQPPAEMYARQLAPVEHLLNELDRMLRAGANGNPDDPRPNTVGARKIARELRRKLDDPRDDSPWPRCENCGEKHGVEDACLVGALLALLSDRGHEITPELLGDLDAPAVAGLWENVSAAADALAAALELEPYPAS